MEHIASKIIKAQDFLSWSHRKPKKNSELRGTWRYCAIGFHRDGPISQGGLSDLILEKMSLGRLKNVNVMVAMAPKSSKTSVSLTPELQILMILKLNNVQQL